MVLSFGEIALHGSFPRQSVSYSLPAQQYLRTASAPLPFPYGTLEQGASISECNIIIFRVYFKDFKVKSQGAANETY